MFIHFSLLGYLSTFRSTRISTQVDSYKFIILTKLNILIDLATKIFNFIRNTPKLPSNSHSCLTALLFINLFFTHSVKK